MHPARLRIHPARPGGGSRASDARPSGRPAPRLPGGPGGDTGGRAPSLPRSFHFESTLRKFAKLVSRWLLSASREGAAHQPAVAAALGGSRWLPRGLGRAAWETGRARRGRELRSRNGWAAPRGSDSGGRLLPGRCAEPAPPLPALSPPPARPRPAPGPAAYCSAPGGGGELALEVRAWRISMETRGRSLGGGGGPAHCPAASPPTSGFGRRVAGRGNRAGKGGLGARGGHCPWGCGSARQGPGATPPGGTALQRAPPRLSRALRPRGRPAPLRTAAVPGAVTPRQNAGGRSVSHPTKLPWTLRLTGQLTRFGARLAESTTFKRTGEQPGAKFGTWRGHGGGELGCRA